MLSFKELTEARRSLQGFCLLHESSLLKVLSGISFKLLTSEKKDLNDGELHHPTTTATCLSSLLDCPLGYRTRKFKSVEKAESEIAEAAFRRKDWTSEGSAGIYCRCRALPIVIKSSRNFDRAIEKHISTIVYQLRKKPQKKRGSDEKKQDRFGIGEAGSRLRPDQWYPPECVSYLLDAGDTSLAGGQISD
jgi:hypothetical protein